jgi:hypothetical protein
VDVIDDEDGIAPAPVDEDEEDDDEEEDDPIIGESNAIAALELLCADPFLCDNC